MPAINVARTDTFELQRQKINNIADAIFNISDGGSDLSTGNLKLGNGTKNVPSLAFTTDSTLGLYKPNPKAIGFVSGSKRIINVQEDSFVSFKDFNVINKSLNTAGMVIDAAGSGYDTGTFTTIGLDGGTGTDAEATIVVAGFSGAITQAGVGYKSGDHVAILSGGNGTGATAIMRVPQITLTTTTAGSNFAPTSFTDVPLTGGNGTGAKANIVFNGDLSVTASITAGGSNYVDGGYNGISLSGGTGAELAVNMVVSGGVVTTCTVTISGRSYIVGDVLTVDAAAYPLIVGASGAGFQFTVSAIGGNGAVQEITISDSGQGYENGDVLSVNLTDVGNYAGAVAPTFTISNNPEAVQDFIINAYGSGYQIGDVLSPSGDLTGVSGTVTEGSFGVTVPDSSLIAVGSIVTQTGGAGALKEGTDPTIVRVEEIVDATIINVNVIAFGSGAVTLTFSPPYGTPSTPLQYTVSQLGVVDSITITDGGSGYDPGDVLTVDARDLVNPIPKVVTVDGYEVIIMDTPEPAGTFQLTDTIDFQNGQILPIIAIYTNGSGQETGFAVLGASLAFDLNDFIITGAATNYTIDGDPVQKFAYKIDGSYVWDNDPVYVDSKYQFDYSDPTNSGHIFGLSQFLDGTNNVATAQGILDSASLVVSVPGGVGSILVGTAVTIADDAVVRDGELATGTKVASVDSGNNTITLDTLPAASGSADLTFTGVELITGVVRDNVNSTLTLTVSSGTPSPVYVYCGTQGAPHVGMAISPSGVENKYVVDPSNPKVFGTGAQFSSSDITETTNISFEVATGIVNATTVNGTTLGFTNGTIGNLTSTTSKTGTLTVDTINADSAVGGANKIDVNAGTGLSILTGDFNIGTTVQVDNVSGNITTSGALKSTGTINSNDQLVIEDNKISSLSGIDIEFEPSGTSQIKITSTSSLIIPAGATDQRPIVSESYNGSIRFNTETNQYEGYSATSSAWSSLGGVRDLDGNTYIIAEETVGANDNTLWFYNDSVNTVKFTPQYLEFENVKKIRSPNITAPDYSEWVSNSSVSLGDYLKHRNNIYEVTAVANPSGTNLTGTSGNSPVHTSGTLVNGDVDLTYYTTAVANLTFDEIAELQVDPLGFTDLVVNNELRLSGNTISTDVGDLLLSPNSGQKITIDAKTSLVLPVGNNNEKGNAAQGSVRYNTDDSQFEGYNGAQWGGLGGVKDIDQDTYVQAESSPGADEDILYFYNSNSNTLQLTQTGLDFYSVDNLNSLTSNELNINASTITFDNLATTLDNTSTTETFLFSTKQHFDLGLSSGLTTDPLLRLTDEGDIFYNLGFGSGVYNGVKLFDSELKELELADYKIISKKVVLERGTLNQGDAILYDPTTAKSAKAQLTALNTTTGEKQFVEYSVVDDGSNIYFTDFGNITTGDNLLDTVFDFNESSQVRLTFTLNSNLTSGDDVEVTVVTHITKR